MRSASDATLGAPTWATQLTNSTEGRTLVRD
jgi:hypothetical protein